MPESWKIDRAAQLIETLLANGYAKYISADVRRAMNAEIDRLLLCAIEAAESERIS